MKTPILIKPTLYTGCVTAQNTVTVYWVLCVPIWMQGFIYKLSMYGILALRNEGMRDRQRQRKMMSMTMKWKTVFRGWGGDPESTRRRKKEQ